MRVDPLQEALDEERRYNARRIGSIRLVAVSIFLAVALLFGVVLRIADWRTDVWLFASYWAAAAALFWLGRRSAQGERLASAGIPLVDMPMVFLITWDFFTRMEPAGPASFAVGAYAALVVLAALSLDYRRIVWAAISGSAFETALMLLAGDPGDGAIAGAVLIGLVAATCIYGVRRTIRLIHGVTEERLRRERMGRYFSPQVAEILAAQGDGLGAGEAREITVLFSDLREFTLLAESMSSHRTVAVLNEFHSVMVDTLFAFGGTLDKYTGDGMMAYFGAPVLQPDHATRAVACALALQDALTALNRERAGRGEPPLRMGIGLHSGTVVVGDVGAPSRREYTAVGDAVNVAARVQELTKVAGADILASRDTRERVGSAASFRSAGALSVPGKTQAIECYVPVRDANGTLRAS